MAFFEIAILSNVVRWVYLLMLFKTHNTYKNLAPYVITGIVLSLLLLGIICYRLSVRCGTPGIITHENASNFLAISIVSLDNLFAIIIYTVTYTYFTR
jgi:hypothetical protein